MTGWARWSTGHCAKICQYEHMVYAQPRISSEEWDEQTSLGFWDTKRIT